VHKTKRNDKDGVGMGPAPLTGETMSVTTEVAAIRDGVTQGTRTTGGRVSFRAWVTVAVAFVGMAFGQTAIAFLTLGVFMKPLGQEFGWNRGQVAMALSVGAFVLLFSTPLVGRLIDRIGVRRVLLPSMFGFGLSLCVMYFFSGTLVHFYGMFVLIGVVGTAANNVSYIRVLSAWFIKCRGLVIGVASAGVAAGQAISVALAQSLVTQYDWRVAYLGLGLLVLVAGFPIVALFLRNEPGDVGQEPFGAEEAGLRSGTPAFSVSRAQALRMPVFWSLIFIAFCMSMSLHGVQIHFVPLLMDSGISAGKATAVFIGLLSAGSIIGRIATGVLFDRFFAPRVAMVAFMLPLASLMLVSSGVGPWAFYPMAFFFGIGLGAESDVLGYFTSRYFGLKSMGELYGYIFGAFMAGSAAGPAIYGLVQARTGSYDSILIASTVMLVMVCVVCATLPRFKDVPSVQT